jgi:manganese-transporting P-type ATPase
MPADARQDSEADFAPNLVNSVCYLVQQSVQLVTFAVNYVGHPFNTGLADNAGMSKSLRMSSAFLALLLTQAFPSINERCGRCCDVCCVVCTARCAACSVLHAVLRAERCDMYE